MDWSLAVGALSIVGLFLSTTWPRIGWGYGLATQVPWAVYGALTHQRGIVLMSVVFAGFYVRALWRWRHTRLRPVREPEATAGEPRELAA